MAFLASKEDNETYTFREMLKQPDAHEFIKSMMKEADDHEQQNHWEVIPRSQLPANQKPILSI